MGVLVLVLRLWNADLHVPLVVYDGDGLAAQMLIQGVLENGWYLSNPRLGAPFGQELHDYAMADGLHFLALKGLGMTGASPVVAFNLYYLLGYPLTACTALFALRRLGASYGPALAAALLFSFLPYHQWRGQGHLFLASYFLVPLSVMVAVDVYRGRLLFSATQRGPSWSRRQRVTAWAVAIGICLLQGSGGAYYAFFACFFLTLAGILTAIRTGRARHLAVGGVLVAVTVLSLLGNTLPRTLYRANHGRNREVVQRSPGEAETFGLKIVQLLLPVPGHWVPWFADIAAKYRQPSTPLVNENVTASLGFVGSVGFVFLLFRLLARSPRAAPSPVLDGLGALNLAAVLLGTIGGLGMLFSLVVTPELRAYNRLSVYIGCFSLFAVALGLERVRPDRAWSGVRRWLFGALLLVVPGYGIADQTNAHFAPAFASLRVRYQADAAFFRAVEESLRPGDMVFQFPYVPFPETPPVGGMIDYDHLRGYLHTRTLRWSYGAMRGRAADRWQRTVAEAPVSDGLRLLAGAGFRGLYVNRSGYPDGANRLVEQLRAAVGEPAVEGRDGALLFFDLGPLVDRLRSGYTPEAWQQFCGRALHPVTVTWGWGMSPSEAAPEPAPRWCAANAELQLENTASVQRHLTIRLGLRSGTGAPAQLRIEGPGWEETATIDGQVRQIGRRLAVPPGASRLRLSCNGPQILSPGDPREMVFVITDFLMQPEDD
jgi:phosphoglycerol transferase